MKDKSLIFYGLLDFYTRKDKIKNAFQTLSVDEKILYKKEVYSICFEREYAKDLIWEYLNEWKESEPNLDREYLQKLEKANKRKKYEDNDTIKIGQLE